MSKDKPKVGDILYSLNVGNAARNTEQVLTPVEVTKVGRKYFYAGEGWRETQYHIDDWCENTNYSARSLLYKTEQEWYDEKESTAICRYISKSFDYSRNKLGLSLDQLRRIEAITKERKA